MLGKWSPHSVVPLIIWLLPPCFIFAKIRLEKKWIIVAIFRFGLINLHLVEIKIVSAVLCGEDLFPPLPPLSHSLSSQTDYCHSVTNSMTNVPMSSILSFPSVQTFTSRKHHLYEVESSTFLPCSKCKKKVPLTKRCPNSAIYGTNSSSPAHLEYVQLTHIRRRIY